MIQKILIQMRMMQPLLLMRHVMAGLVSYTFLSWSTTMSIEAALSPGLSWKRFEPNCFVSYEGCMMYQPIAWENSPHLATLPLVSSPNDIWETRAEIPYWWQVTTQTWVMLLIGWIKFPTRHNHSEVLPRSGYCHVIRMEFLHSFVRRHLEGKPVLGSLNVSCFLRLIKQKRPCTMLFYQNVLDFQINVVRFLDVEFTDCY